MKPRPASHGSPWYTACYCAGAGAWAASLQSFLWFVSCLVRFLACLTLHWGPSLWLLQARLILPHGLNFAARTNGFKNTTEAVSFFLPQNTPPDVTKKSMPTPAYFFERENISRTDTMPAKGQASDNPFHKGQFFLLCAAAWPCAMCTVCDAEPGFGSGSWCADGWKWLATGSGDSNSSCYKNYHFCALSVTNSTLDFPLLFNPLNSRARSHKNSFQYLHHRNSPKP